MTGPAELPVPPPELLAEAVNHPGGRIAAIDHSMVPNPDGYVPPEAVTGGWTIDERGTLSGYEPNPHHGPPKDDFTKLTGTDQWLDWLGKGWQGKGWQGKGRDGLGSRP
jgi:hypothetical protein